MGILYANADCSYIVFIYDCMVEFQAPVFLLTKGLDTPNAFLTSVVSNGKGLDDTPNDAALFFVGKQ